MVMSPEKHVLLCAKVLEMNSKSHEVDGAEECRLLAVPWATECSPHGSSCSSDFACLQDRPVQAAIPKKGAKRLFFSEGRKSGDWIKAYVETRRAFCRAGVRAHSNVVWLLHVYKLSPCKRRSLGEESAVA